MCGIAGIYHFEGRPVQRERLLAMGRLLQHRGPDGQGIHLDRGLGLVHRRLSIIDLDPRSDQPMHFEGCILVYNGEIFNYLELRSQLEDLGHRFSTDSDSEVLIRGYLQWGRDCLQRFNGMWAFALWDDRRRALWCARDRFGVKPFYYARKDGEFRFASEPKALLGDDPALREVNPRPLGRFLVEGIMDDEPETFYREIVPLPPAHELWLPASGELLLNRYWQLTPGLGLETGLQLAAARLGNAGGVELDRFDPAMFPSHPHPEFYTAVEALRALFTDAVRLRLRSDVPVGTCLSGGMDSSSIVALATALRGSPVQTFSSDYTEADCCESEFIRCMVEGCQTEATLLVPRPEELVRAMDCIAWAQDEPTASAGVFTQWKVMQAAQGSVKVLLDGQGGDEILAGYLPYFETHLWDCAFRGEEVGELGPAEELTGRSFARVVRKARLQRRLPAFLRKREKFKPDPYKPPGVFSEAFRAQLRGLDRSRTGRNPGWPDRLSRQLAHDLAHISIPQLLRYEDRNSMAFGLEARTPFLDYRLVEFVFSLPSSFKIHRGWTKRILRSAMAGIIPPAVVSRRDKKGYPTPQAQWFRGPLREWLGDLLSESALLESGWFKPERVRQIFDAHQNGEDRSWELWRFASTLTWRRLFLAGQGFADPPSSLPAALDSRVSAEVADKGPAA
jgi:asparagine synthase (glutamine-hydrolysing)